MESYLRGDDLIATFERRDPITVAPQIYWRAKFHAPLSAVAIEVVISMHTDLLDSEPYSAVDSVCFNSTLFHSSMLTADGFRPLMADDSIHRVDRRDSETNTFVLRNSQLGVSYAEMVHPVDFDAAEIDLRGAERGDFCVRSFLFPERLEKGVIRRGRICGWFMPAENDLQSAVELARQFVDEPLPLTT